MALRRILSPSSRPDVGLALLRVVLGAVFAAHGAQKLFVYGTDAVTGSFTQMGAPLPDITGPLVSGIEFAGGMMLMLGLFGRIVATALALDMLAAMVLVHIPHGFFLPGGVEFVLALFAGALAIALTGPGMISLDAALMRRRLAHQ